jgi:hypothetical protein
VVSVGTLPNVGGFVNVGSFDSLKNLPCMVDPVCHALFGGDPGSLKDSLLDRCSSSDFKDMGEASFWSLRHRARSHIICR